MHNVLCLLELWHFNESHNWALHILIILIIVSFHMTNVLTVAVHVSSWWTSTVLYPRPLEGHDHSHQDSQRTWYDWMGNVDGEMLHIQASTFQLISGKNRKHPSMSSNHYHSPPATSESFLFPSLLSPHVKIVQSQICCIWIGGGVGNSFF